MRTRLALGALLLLVSCTSGGSVSPTPTTPAPPPSAITGFHVEQPKWQGDPSKWSLRLMWDTPAAPFVVDHYELTRDGATISTSVTTARYVDEKVKPATRYRYGVVAVDKDGRRTPETKISVKTGKPAVSEARLSSRYLTTMKITSSNVGASSSLDFYWIFSPTCKTGPCSDRLKIEGHGLLGTLSRSGGTYSGTFHAPFLIFSCRRTTIPETLVVSIHVTGARVMSGAWEATGFAGTFSETASSSGCVTGHNSYTVQGKVGA